MAPSFGRSISFPLSPARSSSSSNSKAKQAAARHVRSISLPSSRTHPLLAHLQNAVRAVQNWAAQPASASAGLAHIDALHAALAELLLLPEARAALSSSATADCLLDGFLALADAYGAFQEAVLDLKRHAADVQAALRRRDAARLASAVRAQRQADKDMARIASSLRGACSSKILGVEVEVSGLLAEAMAAVASASAAVFSALEVTSSAATTAAIASSSKKSTTIISALVKRRTTTTKLVAPSDEEKKELAALQRLQDLDDCIAHIQAGTDKVFRSILHTRVALLNIQTNTCC